MQEEQAGENMEAAAPVSNEDQAPVAEAPKEEHVPLSALQAERENRQRMQEELELMRNHIELLKTNQHKAEPPKNEFDSLSDDDVLTVGEAKKFISNLDNQYKMTIEELRMAQKHSDYEQVVRENLPEVLRKKPYLANTLASDPNRYQIAYDLAKEVAMQKQASQQKEVHRTEEAQRIMENAQKTGSLSSIGRDAPTQEPSHFKAMSDEEFLNFHRKNLGLG